MNDYDEPEALLQYDGTATYKATSYRVSVICKASAWKKDVEKAVGKAGGYNVSLGDGKILANHESYAYVFAASRITYEVTFTPDHALTENASRHQPAITLIKGDFSIIRDGDLQESHKAFKQSLGQNLRQPIFRLRP